MKTIKSDEDCSDCICRVCARNSCNDSYNANCHYKECKCDCSIGDFYYDSEKDCAEYLSDEE